MTSNQQNLINENNKYSSGCSHGKLPLPPAKAYVILTCMDARIDPAAAFGINLGEANVIRNAGGNTRDAFRSIIISNQLLGTKEIFVIKHTECGMLSFKNEDALAVVEKNVGSEARAEIQNLDFQPFSDLEQAVKDDVSFLKSSKAVPHTITVTGWIYDLGTGKLKQVV